MNPERQHVHHAIIPFTKYFGLLLIASDKQKKLKRLNIDEPTIKISGQMKLPNRQVHFTIIPNTKYNVPIA